MAFTAPDVAPEPIRPPQLQSQASEETFGGGAGLEKVHQAIAGINKEAGNIAVYERVRADQSAVEEAVGSKLSPAVTKMLYDPTDGALAKINQTTSMKDALKVHEDTIKKFNEFAKSTAGSLSGEAQIGGFNKHAYPMADALNKTLMVHVDEHGKQLYQKSFDSFVTNTTAQAALGWGSVVRDSNQQKQNLNSLQEHINAYIASSGQGSDQKEALESKVFSNYHSEIINRMLADGKFKIANEYFKDNKKAINDLDIRSTTEKNLVLIPKQQEMLAKYQKDQMQDANMRDAMMNAFNGDLSPGEVQRLFMTDKIDKGAYTALDSIVSKPDYQINKFKTMDAPGQESDPSTFNSLRSEQLSHQLTPGEMTRKILEAHNDGKLSATDGAYLTHQAKSMPPNPRDEEVNAAANYVRSRLHTSDPAASVLGSIVNFFHKDKEGPNPEVESMVSQFYKQADKTKATGSDLKSIRDQIVETSIRKKYPGLPPGKLPDIMLTVSGKVIRLLNPDEKSMVKPRYKITPTPSQDVDQE